MLEVAHPLWLAGLVLVPAIRRLHRYRDIGYRYPVTSLLPWRAGRTTVAPGPRLRRPDPAWRRRAAVVAALVLSLAAPGWRSGEPAVTVWIDDSLSMATIEAGGASRWAMADAAVTAALAGRSGDVLARSLSDPADRWPLPTTGGGVLPGALPAGSEPVPPAPALLDPDREHWLVTDGADPGLNAWASAAPLSRILQVGSTASNLAVHRAGASSRGEAARVLVAVRNHGEATAKAGLILETAGATFGPWPLTVPPQSTVTLVEDVPVTEGAVIARLEPGDALAEDDSLTLDLEPLAPVTARVLGACPPALLAALSVHPGLRLVAATASADLTVRCGDPVPGSGPPLDFLSGPPGAAGLATWTTDAAALHSVLLPDTPLRSIRTTGSAGPGSRMLLKVGEAPAVYAPAGEDDALHIALDLTDATLTGAPAFPLLISALAQSVTGRPLLHRQVEVVREDDTSRVRPLALPAPSVRSVRATATHPSSVAPWLLLVAFVLIAADALRTYRAGGAVAARTLPR